LLHHCLFLSINVDRGGGQSHCREKSKLLASVTRHQQASDKPGDFHRWMHQDFLSVVPYFPHLCPHWWSEFSSGLFQSHHHMQNANVVNERCRQQVSLRYTVKAQSKITLPRGSRVGLKFEVGIVATVVAVSLSTQSEEMSTSTEIVPLQLRKWGSNNYRTLTITLLNFFSLVMSPICGPTMAIAPWFRTSCIP
jgi:hypothetical protein